MNLLKTIAAASVLILSAQAAHAELSKGGLFVEPSITYQSAEMKTNYPAPFGDSTEKTKGFGLGVRLGFHVYESIFIGADARYSMLNLESSALNDSGDANGYNYGATVGVQTPVAGLRVWGTYILGGELDPKQIGSVDVKYKDQKGYRVGAGLYVSMVSVNLEYQDTKYDSLESTNGITGSTNSITGEDKAWIASVSFPVSL